MAARDRLDEWLDRSAELVGAHDPDPGPELVEHPVFFRAGSDRWHAAPIPCAPGGTVFAACGRRLTVDQISLQRPSKGVCRECAGRLA